MAVFQMIYQNVSEKVTGEKAKELSPAEADEFIGDYYNDELEIFIKIEKTPGGLEACNLMVGKIRLFPTFVDQFRCDDDFFS